MREQLNHITMCLAEPKTYANVYLCSRFAQARTGSSWEKRRKIHFYDNLLKKQTSLSIEKLFLLPAFETFDSLLHSSSYLEDDAMQIIIFIFAVRSSKAPFVLPWKLWCIVKAAESARSLCSLRKFALSTLSIKWKYHKKLPLSASPSSEPVESWNFDLMFAARRLQRTHISRHPRSGWQRAREQKKQKQLPMFEEVTGNDLMVCGRQQKWNKIDFLRSSSCFLRIHSIIFRSGGQKRHSLPPFPIRICHTHASPRSIECLKHCVSVRGAFGR